MFFKAFVKMSQDDGNVAMQFETLYLTTLTSAGPVYTLPKITPESRGKIVGVQLYNGQAPTLALSDDDRWAVPPGAGGPYQLGLNDMNTVWFISDGGNEWYSMLALLNNSQPLP